MEMCGAVTNPMVAVGEDILEDGKKIKEAGTRFRSWKSEIDVERISQ